MIDIIKATFDISIKKIFKASLQLSCNYQFGVRGAVARSKTIGIMFETCFPFWL